MRPTGKADVDIAKPLQTIAQTFIEGLFPRFCARCEAEGADFCAACLESYLPGPVIRACVFCGGNEALGWTCASCAPQTHLDGCVSLAPYGDAVVRRTLQAWKYRGNRDIERVLVRWIRALAPPHVFPACDWTVTSVPLHPARKRERGFDQAQRIAQALAVSLGRPCEELLRRTHWTEPQARRGASERQLGELDHAFAARVPVSSHVILCDDVVTSAATMDAAALALKRAGVQVVFGFSVARGRHEAKESAVS